MNKKKIVLGIMLDLVFLVVFNVCFFVVGGMDHTASVWISYVFIHFAYLMVLFTPILTRKNSLHSCLFGLTIAGVSTTYFIVEFLVGLMFILVAPESFKVALVVQMVIAGVYLVMLLINMMVNEDTADELQNQQDGISFIKNTSLKVKGLLDKIDDKKINKVIERVYDFIHSSPTKTCVAVQLYESDVMNKIELLENYVFLKDKHNVVKIANEIIFLMEERNKKL